MTKILQSNDAQSNDLTKALISLTNPSAEPLIEDQHGCVTRRVRPSAARAAGSISGDTGGAVFVALAQLAGPLSVLWMPARKKTRSKFTAPKGWGRA